MATLKKVVLVLFFTFLKIASSLVARGDVDTASHLLTSDNFDDISSVPTKGDVGNNTKRMNLGDTPFPPPSPVTVDLSFVTEDDVITEILVPVTAGGIEFDLVFDTGSGLIWVTSDGIRDPRFANRPRYPVGGIQGCDPAAILYGDGTTVSGLWIKDQAVKLSTCARNPFSFIAVTKITNDKDDFFANNKVGGIFGAGVLVHDEERPEPWLSGTKFAIDINRGGKSTLTFGPIQLDEATTVNLDTGNEGRWAVPSSTLRTTVVLDSGSDYLVLPPDFVDSYLAGVKAWPPYSDDNEKDYWLVDCGANLGDMDIGLGNKKSGSAAVKISGSLLKKSYNKDDIAGRCRLCISAIGDDDDDDDEDDEVTLGVALFVDHIVKFDEAGGKVSITSK